MKTTTRIHAASIAAAALTLASTAKGDTVLSSGSATTNYLADGSIVYTFTNTTATTWTVPYSGSADILLVGGGGGGGILAGGGGGGGQVIEHTLSLVAGQTYDITVGVGGIGAQTNSAVDACVQAANGGTTTAFGLSALGGGAGGGSYVVNSAGTATSLTWAGKDGASGGGAGGTSTSFGKGAIDLGSGETNDGATAVNLGSNMFAGGGGGGAGGKGIAAVASPAVAPTGGIGVATMIFGEERWFGGGGGGGTSKGSNTPGGKGGGGDGGRSNGSNNTATPGLDADQNSGGGGGGGGRFYHHTPDSNANAYTRTDWHGGKGADGVVVVRIHLPVKDAATEPGIGGNSVMKIRENGTNYMVHVFSESGTFEIAESVKAELLVVGGGGAGGSNYGFAGGGGGGGGVVHVSEDAIIGGMTHVVTVGNGGAVGDNSHRNGYDGEPSSFNGYTALGGGGGGAGQGNGSAGASGGGAGADRSSRSGGAGTSGQGHDGGSCFAADTVAAAKSGGGGGAGSPGEDGTSSGSGAGGDGIFCSITGTAVYYGGGGGGGNGFTAMYGIAGGLGGGGTGAYTYSQNNSCIPATAGEPNTGGGGGGGGAFGNTAIAAGAGGSGVVIIRYALSGDPPTVISFR